MTKGIAKRISDLRSSMKLTQSQFAELADLSEDSIGKIERGVTVPTLVTLKRVADGLKIPLSGLLEETPSKEKTPDKAINDFVKYMRTKSANDVRLIHEIAVKILERK